jgi:hypothetical protein
MFDAVLQFVCENPRSLSLDETGIKSKPFFRVLKVDEIYLFVKTKITYITFEQ